MDWHSRKVLSWRLSNTLEPAFCVEALEEALALYGKPEIFNTDQGSQFTSTDYTDVLKEAGVRISMDSRGRWMDNVFIERLWRSLKYECVYLDEFESGSDARRGIGNWISFYNSDRPHSTHQGRTPDEVYTERTAAPAPSSRSAQTRRRRRRPPPHRDALPSPFAAAGDRRGSAYRGAPGRLGGGRPSAPPGVG
jgi:putative transposase